MKHKYADVIIAWANGETVQFKYSDSNNWVDYPHDNADEYYGPIWNDPKTTWRVKPIVIKYRLALMFDKNYGHYVSAENTELDRSTLQSHNFVKWISDWINVEV